MQLHVEENGTAN